jgi:hypothetical protein
MDSAPLGVPGVAMASVVDGLDDVKLRIWVGGSYAMVYEVPGGSSTG